MTLESARFRKMFTQEALLSSNWYKSRLQRTKKIQSEKLTSQKATLESYMNGTDLNEEHEPLNLQGKLKHINKEIKNDLLTVSVIGSARPIPGTDAADVGAGIIQSP